MTSENLVTIDIDDDDDDSQNEDETSNMRNGSLIPEVCIFENNFQRLRDDSETNLNESQPLLDQDHDHLQSITYNQFPGKFYLN
jgi:hypothetical protein